MGSASTKRVTVAWAAAVFLLPIQAVSIFPWLGGRVQPPDLIIVILAISAAPSLWRSGWPGSVALDVAAAWPLAMAASLLLSGQWRSPSATLEVVGAFYLLLLYVVVRLTATPERIDRFLDWYPTSVAIAAFLGLVGVAAAAFGTETPLTTPMAALPYVGQAARAQALTPGPQMLANLLLAAIPLTIARAQTRGWTPGRRGLAWLLILGLLATHSKTVLSVIVALAIMSAVLRRHRRLAAVAAAAAAVTFLAVTHVVVTKDFNVPGLEASQVLAGTPWTSFSWGGDRWVVAPTTYVANKAASLQAISDSWPIGLGPAQQASYAAALRGSGDYPASIHYARFMEPHSTYLGTAAELGGAGVVAGLLLIAAGISTLRRWVRSHPSDWTVAAVCGIFAGVLLEASATDLMNCRHYWWLLAIVAAKTARPDGARGHVALDDVK